MFGFCDSDNFIFKLDEESGHLAPHHFRELGEKTGNLYSPSVKWSDVAINGVSLEKTFEYEDDIVQKQGEKSVVPHTDEEKKYIMVNRRPSQPLIQEEDIDDKRWVKRLERLYPINFQEAKKKRKSIERYPVKPKSKKQVRDEKIHTSSDKFQEITDEKSGLETSLDYTIYIHRHGDYNIIEELDMSSVLPSNPWLPLRFITYKRPIRTKYCPPLHWIEPEVQWEKIWSHVDELKTGKKRDYHYYPNGIANCEEDPCIYFYDKDSDDLNYDFDWSKDFMNEKLYFGDYY